ncbi:hypothetical protein V8G54_005708 [Vigna mungo]|uniref:Cell division cycle protein 123 homolog n=1 Tax=Vigna mungo TaxID=3915 RepID=A0AAQ3NXM3_VIGMU
MKVEEVNLCQIQEWALPVTVSVLNEDALPNRIHNPYEEEDFQVSEGSRDEAESFQPPSFPELELKIKEYIESLRGAAFPKLNWSAPKDSAWTSTVGTLRCTSFTSDSLVHDLCHAYDSCQDKSSARPHNFFLALCKWYPSLQPDMEFRCFIRNQRIVEYRCAVRPGLKAAVPFDYLDTIAGSGWEEFLRNADEELRQQPTETGA